MAHKYTVAEDKQNGGMGLWKDGKPCPCHKLNPISFQSGQEAQMFRIACTTACARATISEASDGKSYRQTCETNIATFQISE